MFDRRWGQPIADVVADLPPILIRRPPTAVADVGFLFNSTSGQPLADVGPK